MKKLLAIPLLCLYMIATTGIIINLHYCGEQIESWAVNDRAKGCEDDPCDEEDTEEHNCCKDKAISSKISIEQVLVSQFKFSASQKFILPASYFYLEEEQTIFYSKDTYTPFGAHAPPGNWQSIPLYKLHSSLTYYG